MATDFLPAREAELLTWSTNFNAKLGTITPSSIGLTPALVTAYAALHDTFAAAFQTAHDPLTRSPASIVAKNTAKSQLIASARQLAGIIQKHPLTTDTQRTELGLTVPSAEPTPIPPPAEMPVLELTGRIGTRVSLRLHDGSGTRRGKPAGVAGAMLYSHVGAVPPAELGAWTFQGNKTRTLVDVEFDAELVPGTIVWFTAFWFNPRGQAGPGCAPVSAILAGGAMAQAA